MIKNMRATTYNNSEIMKQAWKMSTTNSITTHLLKHRELHDTTQRMRTR